MADPLGENLDWSGQTKSQIDARKLQIEEYVKAYLESLDNGLKITQPRFKGHKIKFTWFAAPGSQFIVSAYLTPSATETAITEGSGPTQLSPTPPPQPYKKGSNRASLRPYAVLVANCYDMKMELSMLKKIITYINYSFLSLTPFLTLAAVGDSLWRKISYINDSLQVSPAIKMQMLFRIGGKKSKRSRA